MTASSQNPLCQGYN